METFFCTLNAIKNIYNDPEILTNVPKNMSRHLFVRLVADDTALITPHSNPDAFCAMDAPNK